MMSKEMMRLERLSHSELVSLHLNTLKIIKELRKQLAAYEKNGLKPKVKYDNKWSWMQKIVFALTNLDKPALAIEIVEELQKFDDHFDCYSNPLKAFSTFTARAVNRGIIIKHRIVGFKGCHYALPEWCDEEVGLLGAYRKKLSLI